MRTTITVGVISRAHGVKGEVVVELRTDEPERRFVPGAVLLLEGAAAGQGALRQAQGTETPAQDTEAPRLTVVRTREQGQPATSARRRWLIAFAEVGDRNAAEALRGVRLATEVPADESPEQDEEFYDRQLVGLSVITEATDEPVGTVTSVLHLPAQDVLEIDTASGTRLVPLVTDLVPEIDLDAGRIVVAAVDGLLQEPEEPGGEERR